MKRLFTLIALLLLAAPPAHAADLQCLPAQVGGSGQGYVYSGDTPAGEWAGWWCPDRWGWGLNHMVRPPGFSLQHPANAGTLQGLGLVRAYIAANPMGGHCNPPGASVAALCNAMRNAAAVTMPPLPEYVVAKATGADGTRPTYRRSADGKSLVPNTVAPTRATAGAPCSCWWQSFASGSTDYCSVAQLQPREASPLAVCVKKP